MIASNSVCLAYETVEKIWQVTIINSNVRSCRKNGYSRGAKYLGKPFGGFGILLGGVTGVRPANVMIIGGGVAGTEAALMAAGLGANVPIFDNNLERLRDLEK